MGTDPGDSVVDPFLQTHDVPGLFAAGSGAFATSSTVNPTVTSVSLSIRMAEKIVETAR